MTPVSFPLGDKTYYLLLNGMALFAIYDKFGTDGSVFDPIDGNGRDAFDHLCWYLGALAEQGELFRRYQGYDKMEIPTQAVFRLLLSPMDIPSAKAAVRAAIMAGFSREEDHSKPKDSFTLEYERKNQKQITKAQYLNIAAQFLGVSVKEALLLPVGLVLDMEDLEIDRRGLRKDEE